MAASPLMPTGLARQAEISPGISVDVVVLTAGFLAIVALLAGSVTMQCALRSVIPGLTAMRRSRIPRSGRCAAAPGRVWPGPPALHSEEAINFLEIYC